MELLDINVLIYRLFIRVTIYTLFDKLSPKNNAILTIGTNLCMRSDHKVHLLVSYFWPMESKRCIDEEVFSQYG